MYGQAGSRRRWSSSERQRAASRDPRGGRGPLPAYGKWSRLIAHFVRCSTTYGSRPAVGAREVGHPRAQLIGGRAASASERPVETTEGSTPAVGVREVVSTDRSLRSLLDHLRVEARCRRREVGHPRAQLIGGRAASASERPVETPRGSPPAELGGRAASASERPVETTEGSTPAVGAREVGHPRAQLIGGRAASASERPVETTEGSTPAVGVREVVSTDRSLRSLLDHLRVEARCRRTGSGLD